MAGRREGECNNVSGFSWSDVVERVFKNENCLRDRRSRRWAKTVQTKFFVVSTLTSDTSRFMRTRSGRVYVKTGVNQRPLSWRQFSFSLSLSLSVCPYFLYVTSVNGIKGLIMQLLTRRRCSTPRGGYNIVITACLWITATVELLLFVRRTVIRQSFETRWTAWRWCLIVINIIILFNGGVGEWGKKNIV